MDKERFQMLRKQVAERRAQRKLMQEGTRVENNGVTVVDANGENYTVYTNVADVIGAIHSQDATE